MPPEPSNNPWLQRLRPTTRFNHLALLLVMLVVGAVGVQLLRGSRALGTYTAPSTIKADCSVDVTGALASWIGSIPNDSILTFPAHACYRVDGSIVLSNRVGLTINGNGATFQHFTNGTEFGERAARTRRMFLVSGGSNITIRNTIVRGGNANAGIGDSAYIAALESQHAYEFVNAKNALLENAQAYDIYGDFIYIAGKSANITARGNTFARNGRQGIGLVDGTDILIENNNFDQVRRSMLDIEANSATAVIRRITFRNNTIGAVRLTFFANKGHDATIDDITISGNVLSGTDMDIISDFATSVKRTNYKILNNKSSKGFGSPQEYIFRFSGVNGVEISGNEVPLQSGRNMKLVGLANVKNVHITNNKAYNATGVVKLLNTTVQYCQSGNLIGNPLVAAPVNLPCDNAPTPDTSKPSAPGAVHTTSVTQSTVALAWSASTDNVGVTGYKVYRGGVLIGSPAGTTYTDNTAAAGQSYAYTVKATDAAGNLSDASATLNVTTSSTPPPPPPPGDPHGLTGSYFYGAGFNTLLGSRTDAALDFTWRSRPIKAANPDDFSVRWRGYITPSRTGWYTFYIRSDSYVRFWLASGKAYLTDWSEHRLREQRVRVYLERGKSYAVRLDFADQHGPATIQLLWSSAKIEKQIIPTANLSHE